MPALTREARKNTPRPGDSSHSLPDTYARLLPSVNIAALEFESVEEKKLVFEDML